MPTAMPTYESVGISRREIRQERANYRQPKVVQGMPIVWYRFNKPDHQPHIGFVVQKSKNESLKVYVPNAPGGEIREQCRHVSDPLLMLGTDAGNDGGCWDFAPWYTDLIKTMVELQSQMADVNRRLDLHTPRNNDSFKGGAKGKAKDD